jgi:cytochrome c biogenesis protein CcmG/thiol:disulfide interchange protein DsbE
MELARDPRIRLAGINYKDAQEKASAFLQENGNPYAAVGADIAGRTSIDWGVYGVPETFVLDRNGRVMFKHVGPLDSRSMRSEIIPQLETLLVQ